MRQRWRAEVRDQSTIGASPLAGEEVRPRTGGGVAQRIGVDGAVESAFNPLRPSASSPAGGGGRTPNPPDSGASPPPGGGGRARARGGGGQRIGVDGAVESVFNPPPAFGLLPREGGGADHVSAPIAAPPPPRGRRSGHGPEGGSLRGSVSMERW